MRNTVRLFSILTTVFAVLAPVSWASASLTSPETPPYQWRRNSWGFSYYAEYFSTNGNYDEQRGTVTSLPSGNSFSSFESTLRGRFAFTPRISVYSGIGFGFSQASSATRETTNSALNNGFVGVDFILLRSKYFRLIPELEASLAFTSNTIGQTTPMVGDGAPYGRAGAFAIVPFKRFVFSAYGGIHAPGDGLAKRFMYNANAEFHLGRLFSVGGGIEGYEAFTTDEQLQVDRTRTTLSANAGSQRFWAYEPALLEARGWVGLKPAPGYAIRAGYAKTLTGLRTAEGQSFLVSLVFNSKGNSKWDEAPTTREKLRRERVKSSDPALQDFNNEVEQGDAKSFEADDTPEAPSPSETEDLDEAERRLERKRR